MKAKPRKPLWAGVFLLVPLAAVWLYAALFWELVKVPSGSMKNTILPGDRLTISRNYTEVHRGDVVVFRFPRDPSTRFVSRIIGLPGETIQIKDDRVYINGQELAEQHVVVEPEEPESLKALKELSTHESSDHSVYDYAKGETDEWPVSEPVEFGSDQPFVIPQDEYFVMGDNRSNSFDSRLWGTVKRQLITGKVGFVYWSSRPERVRTERLLKRIK